jgi:predicted small metal-binding protein
MSKMLRCRDVGLDCDFIARGESEADLLAKAAEHAHVDHGMIQIPEEIGTKALSIVRHE